MDYEDFDEDDDFFGDEEAVEVPDPQEKANKTDVAEILENVAEEAKKVAVKKREYKPRILYREGDLIGPKGLQALRKEFEGYQPPTGGRNPYKDVRDMMHKVEFWAHRLAPRMAFDDFVTRTEQLGRKRPVKTQMQKMRLGMPLINDDETAEETPKANSAAAVPAKKGKSDQGPVHVC